MSAQARLAVTPSGPKSSRFTLASLLGLQPTDARRTALIAGLHFVLGAAIVFAQAPAFGLFVSEFGSQRLPYAYMAIAILVSAFNLAYLRLSNRFPFVPLSFGVLAFLAVACMALWLGLATPLQSAFIFILPVGFQLTINVTVLVLWPLAGRAFDLREAKRTFGVIAGGNWVASLIVGLAIGPLVATLGTRNLLLCAAGAALLALALFGVVSRAVGVWTPTAQAEPGKPKAAPRSDPQLPLSELLNRPTVRPLLAYVVVLWILYYAVDNIMWSQAALRFSDAGQLGAFTGTVASIYGIVAAAMSIFLTGRYLARFGVRNALLLLPVLLTFDLTLLALVGTLGLSETAAFALATTGKVLVVGLGFSLSSTALTLLYQPLPPAVRGRTQALAEGVLQSVAIGLGGLMLLLFTSVLRLSSTGVAWAMVPVGLIWIGTILLIGKQYPAAVSAALAQRRLGEGPGLTLDRDTSALLRTRLTDDAPGVALYALAALEREQLPDWPATLEAALPRLLAHAVPEVRAEALRSVGRVQSHIPAMVAATTAHLKHEQDGSVCAAAIEALASLTGEQAAPLLSAYLRFAPPASTAALTALLRLDTADDLAEARLAELVESQFPAERAEAAAVCGAVRRQRDVALLQRLLCDQAFTVRRSALAAAGRFADASLLDATIDAAGRRETAVAAENALVAAGTNALPPMEAACAGNSQPPQRDGDGARLRQIALARAAGRIGGAAAVALLQGLATAEDGETRTAALAGLARNYRSARLPLEGIDYEVRQGAALAAARLATAGATVAATKGNGPGGALAASLDAELRGVRERLLLLLSPSREVAAMQAALDALAVGDEGHRAYALEAVEMALPASLRGRVMPLVELPAIQELVNRLAAAGVAPPNWTEAEALQAVVASDLPGDEQATGTRVGPSEEVCLTGLAPWTQAATLYHAALQHSPAIDALAEVAALSPFELVRETAAWVARRDGGEGRSAMSSTVEKVLALKRAGMFAQAPEAVLVDLAGLCDEIEFGSGEQIFAKGEPGDSLYIIMQGKVRVRDGERVLNDLTEGDVFGEMALLDPEPRMASVSALEPARLLRLEQEPFRELIHQQPEVALGVIRVLARYLRARAADVASLDARLRELADV